MRISLASVVDISELGPTDQTVTRLAALVKAEIRDRFARGEHPAVAEYLERFPQLVADKDRVVSLIYEEYCLCEESGDGPDIEEFCARYEPWRDSLASQLLCHRALSQVAGIATSVPRYPKPGALFEKFRLRSELGRGGSARVYLAEQTDLGNRLVALKVSVDRGSEPAILGRLVHDRIIPVLTSAVEPESRLRGLCMPYKAGLPLDQVIKAVDPASLPASARVLREVLRSIEPVAGEEDSTNRPVEDRGWLGFPESGSYADGVAWIGLELAEALAYAHERKVLHLDVKPANVLLTGRDGPQLLDFNLAHDPHAATEAAAALRGGTLPYMAPEQLDAFLDKERWKAVGCRADIYSLGLLLREMLTGRPPTAHDPQLPLPRAIGELLDSRRELRPDLRGINPRLPHALDAVVGKCIAFHPSDRYASAADLAIDLRRFLENKPLLRAHNPSIRERARNWFRRNGRALAVTTTVILGIAAIGFGYPALLGPRDDPRWIAAITEFDAGRLADASRALRPLAGQPNSAVPTFYLAASLLRTEHIEDGLPLLAQVLGSPPATTDLKAWGGRHPALLHDVDTLANTLLNITRNHPDRATTLLALAESLEAVSLAIDPNRPDARKTLALVDAARGNLARAENTITSLIDEVGRPKTAEDRKNLLSYDMIRVRLKLTEAQDLLNRCPENDPNSPLLDQLEGCVKQSREDLHRIEPETVTGDEETLFAANYFRIQTSDLAGKIANRRHQTDRARDCYREAESVAERTYKTIALARENPFFMRLRAEVSRQAAAFEPAGS